MRLVIREYLASLKERDELDAVLPDLLTELGFTVYSRPSRGTRQFGVDVAAVGKGRDGVRRVHLFSVKAGDLTRAEWSSGSAQALRPSLEQILDGYIPTRIPAEYAKLPIAICLCFGGAVDEHIRTEVTGFTTRHSDARITFEEWNGDRLAEVILDGILREELLSGVLRGHLRKAVAMVEEPDIALQHFDALLDSLTATPGSTPGDRLSQARLINISLWIIFVWAREANNVEAPFRASERAILVIWQLLHADLGRRGGIPIAAGLVINELVELHFAIWDELFENKVLPFCGVRHALSSAVGSHSAVDVNIKLFNLVGRVAMRGLWLAWSAVPARAPIVLGDKQLEEVPPALRKANDEIVARIDRLCSSLVQIISNNRALLSPIGDWQAIEIGAALTLLATRSAYHEAIDQWSMEIMDRAAFAYQVHGRYPVTTRSYWDLVEHPAERTEEYRRDQTEASILYPMLAVWAMARGNAELLDDIATFKSEELDHCAFQTWLPDADSEAHIYIGDEGHGDALTGIPVTAGTRDALDYVETEVAVSPHYDALSAVAHGHWPIVVLACKVHRLPIPPHLWRDLFPDLRTKSRSGAED